MIFSEDRVRLNNHLGLSPTLQITNIHNYITQMICRYTDYLDLQGILKSCTLDGTEQA